MNKDKFFIYAGPPKTGSTWLFNMLDNHDEVEMPLLKELRYFEIKERTGSYRLLKQLLGIGGISRRERKRFSRFFRNRLLDVLAGKPESWLHFSFILSHFFTRWDDAWYVNLFPKDTLSGDISPTYCSLSEPTIRSIQQLNPQTKVVIGLRDPIDKRWSGAKMKLLRMRGKTHLSEVGKTKWEKVLRQDSPDYDDYTTLLNKWRKYFNDEQILVYYFDELKEDPQKLFNKICGFLEITPVEIENITQKVNEGIVSKCPPEYEKIMVSVQYKYIEKFAKNYPNQYSLAWLEKYRDYE